MTDITEAQVDAMEALFAFGEAMDRGVTTSELSQVMECAIKDGHEMLQISLLMACEALRAAIARAEGRK